MVRKFVLCLIILLLLTGCARIDDINDSYVDVVYSSFSTKKISNNVGIGYKFYVPRGVKLIKNYDYNQTFLVDNSYIYLYVDIISYYYKSEFDYKDKCDYYYKEIDYNGNNGYISICNKGKDIFYVNVFYNYARVEFYSCKGSLNKMIGISSSILNNIDYNDLIIKNIYDDSYGNYKVFRYKVDKPEDAGSNFSQFLEEYVKEDESEKLPDD